MKVIIIITIFNEETFSLKSGLQKGKKVHNTFREHHLILFGLRHGFNSVILAVTDNIVSFDLRCLSRPSLQ